jgi:hypothetical protein
MPVYIYEPDAFKKMIKVEGKEWKRHVKDFGTCGFQAFLDLWNSEYKDIQNKSSKKLLEKIHLRQPDGQVSIYGAGGWHRYIVKGNGEICFMEIMCECEEMNCVEKAKQQGFTII